MNKIDLVSISYNGWCAKPNSLSLAVHGEIKVLLFLVAVIGDLLDSFGMILSFVYDSFFFFPITCILLIRGMLE